MPGFPPSRRRHREGSGCSCWTPFQIRDECRCIGNSNHFFPHARPYRRPDKRSIARCLLKTHRRAWLLQALRRPESPHAWALRALGASVGRAGERGGARAGKPRCVRILTMTAGSSMAAMILNSPPHCGQCSRSISNTRFSRRAQPMRAGASCACSSAGSLFAVPDTTAARSRALGASTPCKRVRCRRGRGTRQHARGIPGVRPH